jgi:lipopolysaccharide transport system ATP-binding protein
VVISARCTDSAQQTKDVFSVTEDIFLNFYYEIKTEGLNFIHGINLYNEQGVNIFNSHDTTSEGKSLIRQVGHQYFAQCKIPKNLLNEGIFTVSFALFLPEPYMLFNFQNEILRFKTIDLIDGTSARGQYVGGFPGSVRPLLNWELKISK